MQSSEVYIGSSCSLTTNKIIAVMSNPGVPMTFIIKLQAEKFTATRVYRMPAEVCQMGLQVLQAVFISATVAA